MPNAKKRTVQTKPGESKTPVRIRSSVKADVTPWWIVSGSLFVIGASCVYAAVRAGE
jgi:hypothetical protein